MDRTERTAIWKGLNRMPYIGDGEMRDMKNLSSDAYPFITTRKGRKPYTFATKIPSPEGEAYRDIERLPEPCEEEMGNVYKITTKKYTPGEFYEYDGIEWIKAKIEVSSKVYESVNTINPKNSTTTIKEEYQTCIAMTENNPPSLYSYGDDYSGKLVVYTGKTTEEFERGVLYQYNIQKWEDWYDYGLEDLPSRYTKTEIMPEASDSIGEHYVYTGNSTDKFKNGHRYGAYVFWQGVWENAEEIYKIAKEEPINPTVNDVILWYGEGNYINGNYYSSYSKTDENGNIAYVCFSTEEESDAIEYNYIPKTTAENVGLTFLYTGISPGEFAECYYTETGYDWKAVNHPKVSRTVTLKDYLDNYDGCGLKKILEVSTLKNDIAALIIDPEGNTRLYYDQKLWNTGGLSSKKGKKLITVGSKLVVGEAGSYLHIKDGAKEFFKSGESFAQSITASYASYGNGGEKHIWSSAEGKAGGSATFKIVAPGGKGTGFEEVYEGLSATGTDFKVEFNGRTYYLTVSDILYEKNKEICAWKAVDWHYDYADILTIYATDCSDDFDWDNVGTGFSKEFFFESTDPHYSDVVAWKKRLWGYYDNVMHGTVADIFDDYGIVDWNTGDNTYTEAISQPLWQGDNITGIAALINGLVYFKEDCITVVTGNYPAVMSSNTIPCRGLPPENRRSVVVANECVYYLSTDGVYRFDGNIPRCISREAKISGTEAVGASDGNKYWLSLKEESGEYALYVYDINYGIWHKEDCTAAASFVMLGGEMHMAVGTEIYNLNAPQEDVNWECELWYDEGTHRKKKYKEIIVRGNVGECELFLKADDGEWKLIGAVEDKMRMKFIPFDCEELHLKLKGKGICQIKSIDRTFEVVG